MKMGPVGCPNTSVKNYHYSLHNNPEEHSSQCDGWLFNQGSDPCRNVGIFFFTSLCSEWP